MTPGGPIFSQPKFTPHRGWRQEMKIMAAHPQAGPWLGALAKGDEGVTIGGVSCGVDPTSRPEGERPLPPPPALMR